MDPAVFRRALGCFATGVTVVTVPLEQPGGPGVHGMTANAFSSVSLEPPLVLVCVDRRARTHELIQRSGLFGVSILRADQVEVSRHFAGQARPAVASSLRYRWAQDVPVLADCLAYLACRLWASYDGGDHTIYVGRVTELGVEEDGAAALAFWRSRYYRLGEAIP